MQYALVSLFYQGSSRNYMIAAPTHVSAMLVQMQSCSHVHTAKKLVIVQMASPRNGFSTFRWYHGCEHFLLMNEWPSCFSTDRNTNTVQMLSKMYLMGMFIVTFLGRRYELATRRTLGGTLQMHVILHLGCQLTGSALSSAAK
jgi:hypothetical protein